MNFSFTNHANQRLADRGIKRTYVEYALRKGHRDNKARPYNGIPAHKTRCQGLVVVHTAEPHKQISVLTTYWHDQARGDVFDRLVHKSNCKQTRQRSRIERKQMRRNQRHNHSYNFWNDTDCLLDFY